VRYGGVARNTSTTEDPMTEDGMALVELLQKRSDDGNLLRAALQAVIKA